MLGMKNHFDISGSIEIHEVDIAGVACTCIKAIHMLLMHSFAVLGISIPVRHKNWRHHQ